MMSRGPASGVPIAPDACSTPFSGGLRGNSLPALTEGARKLSPTARSLTVAARNVNPSPHGLSLESCCEKTASLLGVNLDGRVKPPHADFLFTLASLRNVV